MSEITVRLFGAFRNVHSDAEIRVTLPRDSMTSLEVKELLREQFVMAAPAQGFNAVGLLMKSALANEKSVLLDADTIRSGEKIALLPPVSGG